MLDPGSPALAALVLLVLVIVAGRTTGEVISLTGRDETEETNGDKMC